MIQFLGPLSIFIKKTVLSIYTEGVYRGKKKVCEQSSQTNQHLLTPKKLYHEYKTLYVENDFFWTFCFESVLKLLVSKMGFKTINIPFENMTKIQRQLGFVQIF